MLQASKLSSKQPKLRTSMLTELPARTNSAQKSYIAILSNLHPSSNQFRAADNIRLRIIRNFTNQISSSFLNLQTFSQNKSQICIQTNVMLFEREPYNPTRASLCSRHSRNQVMCISTADSKMNHRKSMASQSSSSEKPLLHKLLFCWQIKGKKVNLHTQLNIMNYVTCAPRVRDAHIPNTRNQKTNKIAQ